MPARNEFETLRAPGIRSIVYRNLPCWYELGFQGDPPTIILRVHNDFINNEGGVSLAQSPIALNLASQYRFAGFCGDFSSDVGFGGILKKLGTVNGFTAFAAEIPKVKGKSTRSLNWHDADAISASFTVLTLLFGSSKVDTTAAFPQLFTVDTITQQDQHGGSVSGEISIPLKGYLSSIPGDNNLPEVDEAMKQTYQKMLGVDKFIEPYFRSEVRTNGWFALTCPGDTCGVYSPYLDDIVEGKGYEFSCHNVDTSIQQLTFLAGLAALHDRAREALLQSPSL